jgi:thiamine-monophosphate kinase
MAKMSEIGEKEFLKGLLPNLKIDTSFVNGFGHDASILDIGLEQLIACKIDRAPFPVALNRGIGDYKTWGRLAVAANVSDLLAVGACPKALMLSLVLPPDFNVESAQEIVLGCEEACIAHDIAFVGGDTKEGTAAQVIGAAWGSLERGTEYGRGSAKAGDYLFIAGQLGEFAGSLALMNEGMSKSKIPQKCIDSLTNPKARIIEGKYLRDSRKVAFACDLSDGLTEAVHIFCTDNVGITMHEGNLPMHPLAKEASLELGVPLWRFALGVGDWAIACVISEKNASSFKAEIPEGLELFEIGQFNNSGNILIQDNRGVNSELPSLINEHFRIRAEDDKTYIQELLESDK